MSQVDGPRLCPQDQSQRLPKLRDFGKIPARPKWSSALRLGFATAALLLISSPPRRLGHRPRRAVWRADGTSQRDVAAPARGHGEFFNQPMRNRKSSRLSVTASRNKPNSRMCLSNILNPSRSKWLTS